MKPLDSLRGLAAIGIALFYHFGSFNLRLFSPNTVADPLYNYGLSFVDLFFVISGFVFCSIYLNSIIDGKITFLDFVWKRISRLYPLHIITLLVVAVLVIFRYTQSYPEYFYLYNDVYHFFLNLFFLQSGFFDQGFSFNAPSWAISVQMLAYVLFFAIAIATKNKLQFLLASIVLVLFGLFLSYRLELAYWEVTRVLVGFFAGCVACFISQALTRSKYSSLSGIIAGLVVIVFLFGMKQDMYRFLGTNYLITLSLLFYPALVIYCLHTPLVNKLLSIKPLTLLGDISYSVFMWHFPIQLFMITINQYLTLDINFFSLKYWVFYSIVVILAGFISYYGIELPLQRRMRKLSIVDQFAHIQSSFFTKAKPVK